MQSLTKQFEAFCRSKPADEEYDFGNPSGCALFHFLSDAGFPVRSVDSGAWFDKDLGRHALPRLLQGAIDGGPGLVTSTPWTYGALADRLAS